MDSASHSEMSVGPYRGIVTEAYRKPELVDALKRLGSLIEDARDDGVQGTRNLNLRLELPLGEGTLPVMVKRFGRQPRLKDWIDTRRGSKAKRSWLAAQHLQARGVGTPPPVAYLERRQGTRLTECYFVTEYVPDMVSFKSELIRLLREDPECARFMDLMQCVADAVRDMHAAGFQHNDLGNQNVFLLRTGHKGWDRVHFLDLNRGRIRTHLSARRRARDLSRVFLPSDLLRVFREMYCDDVPPAAFLKWERFFRRLYAVHAATRTIRHPLRTLAQRKYRESPEASIDYPPPKGMWLWDDRSGQPIGLFRSKDKLRLYPPTRNARIAAALVTALPGVWRRYRALAQQCFCEPVAMAQRVGVAVDPRRESWEHEARLLSALGRPPVLVRCYRHESQSELDARLQAVRDLHADGYPVSIALVQDRASVRAPDLWSGFVEHVLESVADRVEWVEVGHAVNRVKWGMWDPREYAELARRTARAAHACPSLRLMGPAAIDFEYPALLAALRHAGPLHFQALSHLLYVDRRGAPENRQGPFSAVDKFALARAIAGWSRATDDALIVSEVNWPLKGTGVYSPVGSPYESPGPRTDDPSVDEDTYADYMIRYLLLALCSGMVQRVYWWRLAARGYGLVDDTDPSAWRPRPAYHALQLFLEQVGPCRYLAHTVHGDGTVCFRFERPEANTMHVAYNPSGAVYFTPSFGVVRALDSVGTELPADRGTVMLSGRPVYLFE